MGRACEAKIIFIVGSVIDEKPKLMCFLRHDDANIDLIGDARARDDDSLVETGERAIAEQLDASDAVYLRAASVMGSVEPHTHVIAPEPRAKRVVALWVVEISQREANQLALTDVGDALGYNLYPRDIHTVIRGSALGPAIAQAIEKFAAIAALPPSSTAPLPQLPNDEEREPPTPRGREAKSPSRKAATLALLALAASPADAANQRDTMVDSAPLPLKGEPPRFERELVLPMAEGFEWPKLTYFEFHSHNATFVHAWHAMGLGPSCSVADRRCSRPPPPGCYHFIGPVNDFLEAYPYPIGTSTSHVTCTPGAWSARKHFSERIADGTILASALEILYMKHVGARAAAEQPATVMDRLLGQPSFTTNATRHRGRRHKVWNWWLRGLSVVPDGQITPADEIRPRRAGPTSEKRMLQRSETEWQLAVNHAAEWGKETWTAPEAGRPAKQASSLHEAEKDAVLRRYDIFAAEFAPTKSAIEYGDPARAERLVVGVPIARHHPAPHASRVGESTVVLTPLNGDVFALPIEEGRTASAQATQLRCFLPVDGEIHQLFIADTATRDVICALPVSRRPRDVIATAGELEAAINADSKVGWCTADIIQSSPAMRVASLALQRVSQIVAPAPQTGLRIGAWSTSAPVVTNRAALEWAEQPDSANSAAAWDAFMKIERERAPEIIKALESAGPHAAVFAESVRTAADHASEMPMVAQDFPSYGDKRLGELPYPTPPPVVKADWCQSLPPQRVPTGYEGIQLPITKLVRRWCRVEMTDAMNMTARHDFDCLRKGDSSLPRPAFKAWGDGAFCRLPFLDKEGYFLANEIIWERTESGLYTPCDFTKLPRDHKNHAALKEIFGASTDQELCSFLYGPGVCWKTDAPRQMRLGRNVESLKTRVEGVGRATRKLVDAKLLRAVKLCREGEAIDKDDAFCAFVPNYISGIGGQDKNDSATEKRKTGDTSAPHDEDVTTIEDAKRSVKGVPVINFNDLTGPRKPPPGFDGHHAFPDNETKSTAKDIYRGLAYVSFLAAIMGTYVVGFKDDIRWMFWQFYLATSQLWLSVTIELVPFEETGPDGNTVEVWYFCLVSALVMNMGTRPASKIACRFSEGAQQKWRERMRVYVRRDWLPRQNAELRRVIEWRQASMGDEQADPFFASDYTDDFDFYFPCVHLMAHGANLWRDMMNGANIWMSKKVGAGTVLDTHGGRMALSGGFGYLTPAKVMRCVTTCMRAVHEGITRDELESNNSFMVHADDISDLLPGSRDGIFAPLKMPGFGTDIVCLSAKNNVGKYIWPSARTNYLSTVEQLRTRPLASFWCAVPDAIGATWTAPCTVFSRASSDACTDPKKGQPYVFGFMHGCYWKFPISGRWRRKHINVTESLGPAGNVFMFGSTFVGSQFINEVDSSSAASMMRGTAKSPDLIAMRGLLLSSPEFRRVMTKLWVEHCSGFGNAVTDLGSRDEWELLLALASAYGMRLTEVPVTQAFADYAEAVLGATSDFYPEETPLQATSQQPPAARPSPTPASSDVPRPEQRTPGDVSDAKRLATAKRRRTIALDGERIHPHPGHGALPSPPASPPPHEYSSPPRSPPPTEPADPDVMSWEDLFDSGQAQGPNAITPPPPSRSVTPSAPLRPQRPAGNDGLEEAVDSGPHRPPLSPIGLDFDLDSVADSVFPESHSLFAESLFTLPHRPASPPPSPTLLLTYRGQLPPAPRLCPCAGPNRPPRPGMLHCTQMMQHDAEPGARHQQCAPNCRCSCPGCRPYDQDAVAVDTFGRLLAETTEGESDGVFEACAAHMAAMRSGGFGSAPNFVPTVFRALKHGDLCTPAQTLDAQGSSARPWWNTVLQAPTSGIPSPPASPPPSPQPLPFALWNDQQQLCTRQGDKYGRNWTWRAIVRPSPYGDSVWLTVDWFAPYDLAIENSIIMREHQRLGVPILDNPAADAEGGGPVPFSYNLRIMAHNVLQRVALMSEEELEADRDGPSYRVSLNATQDRGVWIVLHFVRCWDEASNELRNQGRAVPMPEEAYTRAMQETEAIVNVAARSFLHHLSIDGASDLMARCRFEWMNEHSLDRRFYTLARREWHETEVRVDFMDVTPSNVRQRRHPIQTVQLHEATNEHRPSQFMHGGHCVTRRHKALQRFLRPMYDECRGDGVPLTDGEMFAMATFPNRWSIKRAREVAARVIQRRVTTMLSQQYGSDPEVMELTDDLEAWLSGDDHPPASAPPSPPPSPPHDSAAPPAGSPPQGATAAYTASALARPSAVGAYSDALQSTRDGLAGVELERCLRRLAGSLGAHNARIASIRSLAAVLAQEVWPERYKRDEDCWKAHQASRGSFQEWRRKLREVRVPVAAEGWHAFGAQSPPPSPPGDEHLPKPTPTYPSTPDGLALLGLICGQLDCPIAVPDCEMMGQPRQLIPSMATDFGCPAHMQLPPLALPPPILPFRFSLQPQPAAISQPPFPPIRAPQPPTAAPQQTLPSAHGAAPAVAGGIARTTPPAAPDRPPPSAGPRRYTRDSSHWTRHQVLPDYLQSKGVTIIADGLFDYASCVKAKRPPGSTRDVLSIVAERLRSWAFQRLAATDGTCQQALRTLMVVPDPPVGATLAGASAAGEEWKQFRRALSETLKAKREHSERRGTGSAATGAPEIATSHVDATSTALGAHNPSMDGSPRAQSAPGPMGGLTADESGDEGDPQEPWGSQPASKRRRSGQDDASSSEVGTPNLPPTPLGDIGDVELSPVGASLSGVCGSDEGIVATERRPPSPPPPPALGSPCAHHAEQTDGGGRGAEGEGRQSATDALGFYQEAVRSPQPHDPSAARKRAALELAQTLIDDTTPHAICPDDPGRIRDLCISSEAARTAAIPEGTRKSDAWGFGWAVRFGIAHSTPWMRPRVVPQQYRQREVSYYAFLIMWLSIMMQPSARTRKRGFDQAKPDSVMNAVHAYRRVLRDCGRELIELTAAYAQLKALRAAYLAAWGDMALTPLRAVCMQLQWLHAMVTMLCDRRVPLWTERLHDAMLAVFCVLCSTGFRLDEISQTKEGTYMKRANFAFFVDGDEIQPTLHGLKRMANGCYVRVRSVRSKCDPCNYHWGSRDMWFIYDDTNPLNLAWRWTEWEVKYPCPPEARHAWAAFSPAGTEAPFIYSGLSTAHRQLANAALGEEIGGTVTVHAHRVTLASGLLANKNCDGTVQAMVRWKSADSMRIYARLRPAEYASIIEAATRTNANLPAGTQLPEHSPADGAADRIDDAIAAVDPARQKGRAKEPAPPAEEPGQRYLIDVNTWIWASSAAPHDIVGAKVNLPNKEWASCAQDAGATMVEIVAYAPSVEKYVVRTPEHGDYAFPYARLAAHFNESVKRRVARRGRAGR